MIVPRTELPPAWPFTSQVRAEFAGVVVAVNCWVAPAATVAEGGEIETGGGSTTATVVEEVLVVSAADWAVTVTSKGLMTTLVAGAV